MGIHLVVVCDGWTEHPHWDIARHSGDRDVPDVMREVGSDFKLVGTHPDFDAWERPKDPDAFAAAMKAKHPANADRWDELAAIFRDPQWWLHYSV